MALDAFLNAHKDEILELTRRRIVGDGSREPHEEVAGSLAVLYEYLVAELRRVSAAGAGQPASPQVETSAAIHGAERMRQGVTIVQLVHDYGALCHSITELAKPDEDITPLEYQILNAVLDEAIADSVTEYTTLSGQARDREAETRANEHLGFVAHELRNAISTALVAFDAIRRGHVAIAGKTSGVLERSLIRLRALVDRSLTEVRLKAGLGLTREPTIFRQLVEEIEASMMPEAQARGTHLLVQADPAADGQVDRQLLASIITNLVQNAIKYSPPGTEVCLRCGPTEGGVVFEVEDQCGGLPEDKIEALFPPFARGTQGAGGLGLGLAITRQAVEAHGGRIHVRNLPGKGCVFVVEIPLGPQHDQAAAPPVLH